MDRLPSNPLNLSQETLYVKHMKDLLLITPRMRGDKACVTFKLPHSTNKVFKSAVRRHGLTVTDVLTFLIENLVPVLEKAAVIPASPPPKGKTAASRGVAKAASWS